MNARDAAINAKFNNCNTLSIWKDGIKDWKLYMGTDENGGFTVAEFMTLSDAKHFARLMVAAEPLFIKQMFYQRSGDMKVFV